MDSAQPQTPGPLVGRSLASHAALTFLLPLATAVTGAGLAYPSPRSQLIGGCLGLLAGMLIARLWAATHSDVDRRKS